MGKQWFLAFKEVRDTDVIKHGIGIYLLEQRWTFACRLPGKVAIITAEYYVALLNKLKPQLVSKHRGKPSKGSCFFEALPAPHQKLTDLHFEVLIWPLSDNYLFPYIKKHLKRRKFSSTEVATLVVNGWFAGRQKEFFLDGLNKLEQ
jgi:hypothetical protein